MRSKQWSLLYVDSGIYSFHFEYDEARGIIIDLTGMKDLKAMSISL